jgi:hypothetical protein
MDGKFSLKRYAENMSSFHQILLTAGLIVVSLISAWQYTKGSILEGERSSLKSSLHESVHELNLVTDSTLNKKLYELQQHQSDIFMSILDLQHEQLLKLDSNSSRLTEMNYLIKKNHNDIASVNDLLTVVGDDIGGNTKKLLNSINLTAQYDSIKVELDRARLQNDISSAMQLMERQHDETIFRIKNLTEPKPNTTRGYKNNNKRWSFEY